MKSPLWIGVFLLAGLVFFGCQQIDGECWPVSEDGAGDGAGAGPIVPGSGGYGISPEPQDVVPRDAEPQDAQTPPAGCGASEDACHDKCRDDHEAKGSACEKHKDEVERDKCREEAYSWYRSCRDECLQKSCTDMFDACQDKGHPCTRQIEPKKTLCAFCLSDCKANRPYKYSECYSCGFE